MASAVARDCATRRTAPWVSRALTRTTRAPAAVLFSMPRQAGAPSSAAGSRTPNATTSTTITRSVQANDDDEQAEDGRLDDEQTKPLRLRQQPTHVGATTCRVGLRTELREGRRHAEGHHASRYLHGSREEGQPPVVDRAQNPRNDDVDPEAHGNETNTWIRVHITPRTARCCRSARFRALGSASALPSGTSRHAVMVTRLRLGPRPSGRRETTRSPVQRAGSQPTIGWTRCVGTAR